MDRNFQDRIDEYLLHADRMTEEDKALFLREIAEDKEKREQYELTKTVKDVVTSRGKKLEAMERFKRAQTMRRKNTIWVSSAAAILVIGFFAIEVIFHNISGNNEGGNVRGGDDVFVPKKDNKEATDTAAIDTTTLHTHGR